MSRRLLALNVLFGLVSVASIVYIARQLTMPVTPAPAARVSAAPRAPAPAARAAEPSRLPPSAYTVVASRNLFSPTRSDAPVRAGSGMAGSAWAKPTLHGVVLRDGASIAYLEDPATKRVGGYRLGDTIAGATVQTISADHVVLARQEGQVDVRLRDPAKPRPAGPPTADTPTAVGARPPFPTPFPGSIPSSGPAALPPPGPGVGQQGSPVMPPVRRPLLPPNLLRRLPPGSGTDATPSQ